MRDKRKKNKKEINWKIQQTMMTTIWSFNKIVKMKQMKTLKTRIKILNQHNRMLWLKFWFQKSMILTKSWVQITKEISLLILCVIQSLFLLELKDYIQLNWSWEWLKLEKSLFIILLLTLKSSKKLFNS